MAKVDPADEIVDRWIVQWYRFDPGCDERRHTIVAAFDNAAEMEAEVSRLAQQLRERRRAGVSEDVEWTSGIRHYAGYKDAMAAQTRRVGPASRNGIDDRRSATHRWGDGPMFQTAVGASCHVVS